MTTIRVSVRQRFTAVDRRAINDAALSFRARGLLVWLLDKPDGWRVNSTEIARHCKEGRDAIRACLRELEAGGYLSRERVRTEAGKWITESVLRELPDDWESATEDGKPGVGKPGVGFPGAITKTVTDDCREENHHPTRSVDDPTVVEMALDYIVSERLKLSTTQPRNPEGYRKAVCAQVVDEYTDAVQALAEARSEWDASTIARRVMEGYTPRPEIELAPEADAQVVQLRRPDEPPLDPEVYESYLPEHMRRSRRRGQA